MGQKRNLKGLVSISNADNRIRLRWRYNTKRYSLNLFSFSKENMLAAKKVAVNTESDMLNGQFDLSLQKYKLHPSLNEHQVNTSVTTVNLSQKLSSNCGEEYVREEVDLVMQFELWVREYRNMNCDTDIDYYSTRNMMKRWGKFDVSTVVSNFNKETFGSKTYNRRLTLLQTFFTWTTKAKITAYNPLEDVLKKKTKKTAKENRKPFTEAEIRQILEALKNDTFCPKSSHYLHSHYYPFVYFIFKTGVRNAEAIGLRVKYIDVKRKLIHIREVLARTLKGTNAAARIRKDTKNGKHRALPLTDDLLDIIAALLQNKRPDDLVFQSPTGLAIDDNMFQRRIFSVILKELKIEHRVLYACRHTFSSRMIDAGYSPVQTAFLLGNNPETALRNYTHQISLPTDLPALGKNAEES